MASQIFVQMLIIMALDDYIIFTKYPFLGSNGVTKR
jgi:hypothetical protein